MNNPFFHYEEVDNNAQLTLFLFHGTGGDEHDFLFLDEILNKNTSRYNLVGVRGNVQENGMNRFFARHAEGVFDQESLKKEVEKLHQFLEAWRAKKTATSTPHDFVALGFSNGANILLALLLSYPSIFSHVLLLHPMWPFEDANHVLKQPTHIFVTHGESDSMISKEQQNNVDQILQNHSAKIKSLTFSGGHGVSQLEMQEVIKYLNDIKLAKDI